MAIPLCATGDVELGRFLGLLNEFNQSWAHAAAALVIIASCRLMTRPDGEKVASPTHSFDAGAAWAMLALQATRAGWQAHGMAGFDRERAITELELPCDYQAEAAIAIGRVGDPASLPERLQARERPSDRSPLSELAFEGSFPRRAANDD